MTFNGGKRDNLMHNVLFPDERKKWSYLVMRGSRWGPSLVFCSILQFEAWYKRLVREMDVVQESKEPIPGLKYMQSRTNRTEFELVSIPLPYSQALGIYKRAPSAPITHRSSSVEEAIQF